MAWLNLTMHNQTIKNRLKVKKIKLSQMNFFLKKQLRKFSCTYWLLSFCKIFKKILGPIQSYEDVPFSGLKWPICHEQICFGTNHCYYFHLSTGPFHCAKFKKILPADPELWGCTIFGTKMVHFSKWEFFSENLPMSLVSFIHAYLHTKNQSQIDIHLLVKYWRLKNTEISLTESHFWL